MTETFLTHLESAIDGTRLPADRLQTTHADRPLLARYDLDAVRAAAENVDADRLRDICSGCRWLPLGYCEEGLRQRRSKDPE